jgi:hypothetical protein
MNKIKNLLKVGPIAMVIVGVLVAGVASAALVNYLSNYTTTTATVTSPIEMSINVGRDGSLGGDDSISIDTTGGSDFTFTIVKKNNANNTIDGYPVTVVKAPSGDKLTGNEFTKMIAEFSDEAGTSYDITGFLYVVLSNGTLEKLSNRTWDNEKLVLFFDNNGDGNTQVYPIDAGEVKWDAITITWAPNLIGTYTIYSQYANNLADYASAQYSQ